MKIKTLIKADFFINPIPYGFDPDKGVSKTDIFNNAILGNIMEIENTKRMYVDADFSHTMADYRERLKEYVQDYYELMVI